jgi:hypothetical protein
MSYIALYHDSAMRIQLKQEAKMLFLFFLRLKSVTKRQQ